MKRSITALSNKNDAAITKLSNKHDNQDAAITALSNTNALQDAAITAVTKMEGPKVLSFAICLLGFV